MAEGDVEYAIPSVLLDLTKSALEENGRKRRTGVRTSQHGKVKRATLLHLTAQQISRRVLIHAFPFPDTPHGR